jgi:hypothetical protein
MGKFEKFGPKIIISYWIGMFGDPQCDNKKFWQLFDSSLKCIKYKNLSPKYKDKPRSKPRLLMNFS